MKLILTILLLFALCIEGYSDSRHIHVIKILDTKNDNSTIRQAAISVNSKIDEEIKLLADRIGIYESGIHNYEIVGENFKREELEKVISYDLRYCYRDIVFLVYLGHGYRSQYNNSKFPELKLLDSYDKYNTLNVNDILLDIYKARPSYVISIVIACNDEISDFTEQPKSFNISSPNISTYLSNNSQLRKTSRYIDLFGKIYDNQTTSILLVGSQKGGLTVITPNGGFFFNSIFNTLDNYLAKSEKIIWDDLLTDIRNNTISEAKQYGITQSPICYINYSLFEITIPGKTTIYKMVIRRNKEERKTMKELKQKQRQELSQLRKKHDSEIKSAKKQGKKRREIRELSRLLRFELQKLKIQHKNERKKLKDYQRYN